MANKIASGCNPIGMSYWRNINFHRDYDVLQVFLSIKDELHILTIRKDTLTVTNIKPLGIIHTGEGCFFSAIDPHRLFIPVDNGMDKIDIENGFREEVFRVGQKAWQMHSSIDECTFSLTMKDNDYKEYGWGIIKPGKEERILEIKGEPDECQIDKSGKWLLIKEDNYNRIYNIETNEEKKIENEEGALGHSDCGFECAFGENDMSPFPGALDKIDFEFLNHENIFSTGIWNMGYVSWQNNQILVTTPNEIIHVNTYRRWNNLTQSQNYEHRPKANLCPLGEYFVWTAFVDGLVNCYLERI